jgi:murein DD-endopeptidase MepM/ murein hydrolase activator NlpD
MYEFFKVTAVLKYRLLLLILPGLLWVSTAVVFAGTAQQEGTAAAPPDGESMVYTVQPGDTVIGIAAKYKLNIAELLIINQLIAAPMVFPGQQLILPGIAAPELLPTQTPAPSPTPPATLTPTPVVTFAMLAEPHIVQPQETMYSIAGLYNIPAGTLALANSLPATTVLTTGQTLMIPDSLLPPPKAPMPPLSSVTLSEQMIMQGRILVVKVKLSESARVSGSFEGQPLIFSESGPGELWAITAIHALLQPNTYPIILTATRPDGSSITHIETVEVIEGPYGQENIQLDYERSALLAPELLAEERQKLLGLWTTVTTRPAWEGRFLYPVSDADQRISSYFGTRRTYNYSAELSFHSGTDFAGAGLPIYAPAAGTVVLAEPLTVRGNAVVINHGLGLYSGYWHQSEIVVTEGQPVQAGDLIGYIGGTGLVTGPHLHWEMRLNGIAINPLQWVREPIP